MRTRVPDTRIRDIGISTSTWCSLISVTGYPGTRTQRPGHALANVGEVPRQYRVGAWRVKRASVPEVLPNLIVKLLLHWQLRMLWKEFVTASTDRKCSCGLLLFVTYKPWYRKDQGTRNSRALLGTFGWSRTNLQCPGITIINSRSMTVAMRITTTISTTLRPDRYSLTERTSLSSALSPLFFKRCDSAVLYYICFTFRRTDFGNWATVCMETLAGGQESCRFFSILFLGHCSRANCHLDRVTA